MNFKYLSVAQKGVEYPGVKLYNKLPANIKELRDNPVKFTCEHHKFLISHSHSVQKFMDSQNGTFLDTVRMNYQLFQL